MKPKPALKKLWRKSRSKKPTTMVFHGTKAELDKFLKDIDALRPNP